MNFSPWDWADSFRLHEAACLIAGVIPLSKAFPDREELPAQAIPIYMRLRKAYVFWVTQFEKPENSDFPKAKELRGFVYGSDKPTLLVTIEKLTGEIVSREELHRWIQAMGYKSAYQFLPSGGGTYSVTTPSPAPELQATPLVAVSASDSVETDKAGPVVPAPAQGNSTKTPRKDSIDPVIELAQTKCRDPKDTNQVWPQMQVLAESEQAPFLASTTKGLKYHKSGEDAYFTRDALDKRLHPEKRKPPAARR